MALTKKQQVRCRACRTFLPSDPIDGEVWARYCPECGFPSELTPDTWTVLTSGLRILVLSSLDELNKAAAAQLVEENDLVFPPDGPEVSVRELVTSQIRFETQHDDPAPESTLNLLYPVASPRRPPPVAKRPALSRRTVAAVDDLLRDRENTTPPLPDFRPVPEAELRVHVDVPPAVGTDEGSRPDAPLDPPENSPPPPSEIPLTFDGEPTDPEAVSSGIPRTIYGWGAVLLMGAAGLGAWLHGRGDSPPTAPLPPSVGASETELDRASVTGELEAVQTLVEQRLERDPKNLEMVQRAARVANELSDEQWIVDQARGLDSATPSPDGRKKLAKLAAQALWASTRFGEVTSSAEARLEKLNALRVTGQIDKARTLVAQIVAAQESPATQYALGMLALADPEAPSGDALPHLKAALPFETAPGRVRAALVLALIRKGNLQEAKEELALLRMLTRSHPAVEDLGRLIAAKEGERAQVEKPEGPPPSRQPISYLLDEAEKAARQNSTGRARRLYHLVLARDANNCEAQDGLRMLDGAEGSCGGENAPAK